MSFFGWFAAIVLFLQLPIPIYWLVVDPFGRFQRTRQARAFAVGLLVSWPPATTGLILCRHDLFRPGRLLGAAMVSGLPLIVFEPWTGGELAGHGIYPRIRHPRYAGSFLVVLGACLLAYSRVAWTVGAAWSVWMLRAILMEEKELHQRFGASYQDYCRRVRRFIPLPRTPGNS
jgi:Phospholipid methyltransferase